MTDNDLERQLADFDRTITGAAQPDECWRALQNLTAAFAGFKLFTVMTVDLTNKVARRAYSSHPADYPVSVTKPIHYDSWFEIVHKQHKLFVANTIADIAKVFPDHEKIWSLGCGSVVNLPVIIEEQLAATINMLHEEHYYSPVRVEFIERHLSLPARRACLAALAVRRVGSRRHVAS
jgi:hypothetical protein